MSNTLCAYAVSSVLHRLDEFKTQRSHPNELTQLLSGVNSEGDFYKQEGFSLMKKLIFRFNPKLINPIPQQYLFSPRALIESIKFN